MRLAPVVRRVRTRPALLSCAAASKAARGACRIRKLFSRFSAGNALLRGRPRCPKSSARPSPAASRGVVAHDALISPCPLPHWVARASCSRLVACKDVARAVARRLRLPQLPAPRAEFAHHSSDSPRQRLAAPPAAPPHVFSRASPTACAQRSDLAMCLAISRCSRVSLPSLRRAKMRPALLLRGPVSKAARAGCPLR